MPESIELTINGVTRGVPTAPERSLLVVLREELGLTGAKYGCAVGACGACTVLVDGAPTRACVTPAAEVTGHAVTTIEGLAAPDEPHPVQAALLATGAPLSAHAGSSEPPPSGVSPGGTVSPRTAVAPLLNPSRGPWDLLAPDERDYFELLDDGLVAVAPPSESTSGQPGPWQRNG